MANRGRLPEAGGEPRPVFIVGEVSKNWEDGREVVPGSGLLAQQFERMLEVNRRRGYVLHSFDIVRTMTAPGTLNETIVAVFRREGRPT